MKPEGITEKQWIRYNLLFVIEHFIGINLSKRFLGSKKQKLFDEISQNEGIKGRGKTFYTEDIVCDNIDELLLDRSNLMKGPVLIKGAAINWECTQQWSRDFFKKYYADQEIILVGSKGLVEKEHQNKFKKESLGDFIDKSANDINYYLRFSRIVDTDKTLRSQIDVKWLDKFKDKLSRGGYLYMFMGEKGSKTTTHAAIIQTLFIQIKGEKKWTVYPANERIFIDPVADRRPYYYTDANPNMEDDPNFPLLKYAKKYEIVLEEGDVLWFPSFYWHYVENLSSNIGVTYKFTDFKESWKISRILTSLLFLTTKPTIIEIFFYNVFKKRDLHFDKDI